jgi:four helix bundle protein
MIEKSKDELREMTIGFALNVSEICEKINGCKQYVDQIIRSSSSIGANLFEAKYAQSRADFINKLEVSLKECSETEYWLELLRRKKKMTEEQFYSLNAARGTIQRMLIASVTTAKNNGKKGVE